MANRENTGKYGKSRNYIKINGFLNFLRGLSWRLLNRLKMLPQDVGTFSTIGQPILRTFIFLSFFDPNRPLPHLTLSPPWPRASGSIWEENVPNSLRFTAFELAGECFA